MTRPERAADYLEHIANAIDRARRYAGNAKSLAGLEQDEQAQDAIVRTLAIVGEAVTRLQKVAPEFIAAHPEVPWNLMRGMRNKISTTTSTWIGRSSGTPYKAICRCCASRLPSF